MRWKEIAHIIEKALDYIVPIAISVVLVVWLFNKVHFRDVISTVRAGCDFRWVIAMMAVTTLSHIVRGVRWGIQLRGAGVRRMSVTAESVAIFGAYSLNLVFPRLGEVWRCVWVSRSQDVSLSTVVGTDVGDRLSDLVVVASLGVLALIVAHPALMDFMSHYSVGRDISHIVDDKLMWLLLAAVIGLFWSILHFGRKFRWVQRVRGSLKEVWQGFHVLFTMNGKFAYALLTIGIWTCYFMETYLMFEAFPFTRTLMHAPGTAYGLVPGLVVFVFGSFSMAIPSNGGLGPWNLAVMFALSLYGITDTQGAAFSMVMWSFQALMLVILGLFSAGYVIYKKRKDGCDKERNGAHIEAPSHQN